MKIVPSKNTVVCGDNLEWLNYIPNESIDLCYIDPPFFSNKNYEIIWGNGFEVASFGDRFSGGISHYIEWMKPRIELIHKKLKNTGSIFLHCDWHASHRLRCLLDDIFGESNFRDEVVWWYSNKYTGNKKDGLVKQHDLIFRYSKSNIYTFNILKTPSKHAGRITSTTKRARIGNKSVKVMKRHENGKLVHQTVGNEKNLGTVFEIDFINSQANERLGYPTQKPEKLVQQLILCGSNKGDVILDCFAGGFTTAKIALDQGRKFICGDVSPVAIRMGTRRIIESHPNAIFRIKGLPGTIDWFQQVDGHVFAEMVCDLMGWDVNSTKSNDKGIDGWDGNGNPVQVKNRAKGSVGRPDIQKFAGALMQENRKCGIFVGWEFAKNAKESVAELKQKQDISIELKDARDIFKELLIPEEKHEKIIKLFKDRLPKNWNYNEEHEFTNGELLKLVS